ncbi:hypothetical protein M501DRAFT_1002443 [Patellaria atrata CBS 101060]|uniref:Uncharacterized protein n=1 Tax=Patellaria atrata CBS 101060 TaxID=1346257 RepID=A0A9P4SCN7_9PEZI|nr:hypothetical protein M501DRAFT_1002443 [Patellaria atrata CBS 101060]
MVRYLFNSLLSLSPAIAPQLGSQSDSHRKQRQKLIRYCPEYHRNASHGRKKGVIEELGTRDIYRVENSRVRSAASSASIRGLPHQSSSLRASPSLSPAFQSSVL